MNKYITQTVLFFLIQLNILGQSDSIKEIILFGTCESGNSSAIEDFQNERYVCASYGLIINEDWQFKDFHKIFIEDKYGIILKIGDCVVTDESICYEKKMHSLILNKFGADIFDKVRLEARKHYDSLLQVQIEANEIISILDTIPSFLYGTDSLFSYLGSMLENNANVTGKIYAELTIEKDGSVSDVYIIKGINKEIDTFVIEVFRNMPKWNPGVLNGQIVRSKVTQPIRFSPQ